MDPNYSHQVMLRSTVTGYAYKASQTIEYLAMAVLLAHAVIAFSYVFYVLLWNKARTSVCWDTQEELLVLAHSSRPSPAALANTCAGIHRSSTMSQVVCVRVLDSSNATDGTEERVQLVIDNTKILIEEAWTPVVEGRKYGQIHQGQQETTGEVRLRRTKRPRYHGQRTQYDEVFVRHG